MSAIDDLLKGSGANPGSSGGAIDSLLQGAADERNQYRAAQSKRDKEEEEKRKRQMNALRSLASKTAESGSLTPQELTKLYEGVAKGDVGAVSGVNRAAEQRANPSTLQKVKNFGGGLVDETVQAADRLVVQPVDALLSGDKNDTNIEGDLKKIKEQHDTRLRDIEQSLEQNKIDERQAEVLRAGARARLEADTQNIGQRQEWSGTGEGGTGERLRIATGAGIEAGASVAGGIGVKALAGGGLSLLTKGGASSAAGFFSKGVGGNSIRSGIFSSALGGAGAGGGIGLGTSLQGDDFSWGDVASATATGAGIGAALGGGLAAGGGVLSRYVGKKYDFSKGSVQVAAPDGKRITDPTRLLPARASEAVAEKTTLLSTIEQNPRAAIVVTGADPKDIQKLRDIDSKVAAIQQGAESSADEVRALIKQRATVVGRIQNPTTDLGKRMSEKDSIIAEANASGDSKTVIRTANERSMLENEALLQAQKREADDMLSGKVTSSVARNTESQAILEGLSEGFGDLPQSDKIVIAKQIDDAVAHMKDDPQEGLAIAMGQAEPPAGRFASAYYEAAKTAAIESGNTDMMERLATQSGVGLEATKKGQFNAIFANKDPENPIDAMNRVMQARAKNPQRVAVLTPEEKTTITEFGMNVQKKKSVLLEAGQDATPEQRIAYGLEAARMRDYVRTLTGEAEKTKFRDILKDPDGKFKGVAKATGRGISNTAGFAKSAVGAWDNSFMGRQGLKVLVDNPKLWGKESARSFYNFYKGLTDPEAELLTEAYVLSRPNNLNGMYKRMGLDVVGISEEAIPSRGPESLPVVGRVFRGSNAAYTGFAQRARVDTADKMLIAAKEAGRDITDPKVLKSLGSFSNNLTGRGGIGRAERIADEANKIFFSPRLLVSNFNYLTAHALDPKADMFIKKRALGNVLKAGVGAATALKLAEAYLDAEVEFDPRSSDFGKVKIRNTRYDISGGVASIITLASRVAPVLIGKPGKSKSSTSGEVRELGGDGPYDTSYADLFTQFTENKLSPAAGSVWDIFQGEKFGGEKPTPANTLRDITIPLSVQTFDELKNDKRSGPIVQSMIAEVLGFGTTNYGLDQKWDNKTSKYIQGFKKSVNDKQFQEANERTNDRYIQWYGEATESPQFQKLPQKERESLVSRMRERIAKDVMREYGYEYKPEKKDRSTQGLIDELERL